MEIKIEKILASGSYKSFALINVPNYGLQWISIPRELYWHLRKSAVPTAQSFRKKKED